MAEKGGPLPKSFKADGRVGEKFTGEGAVGGRVQRAAEKEEGVGERMAQEARTEQQRAGAGGGGREGEEGEGMTEAGGGGGGGGGSAGKQ